MVIAFCNIYFGLVTNCDWFFFIYVVCHISIFIFEITNCDLKRFCQTFVWRGYSLSFPLLLPVSSLPPYLHLPIL